MSEGQYRRVEFETDSIDWNFTHLSKKFEVNINDYKRWIHIGDMYNRDIPLNFEETINTSSRTIFLRFSKYPDNHLECCRKPSDECSFLTPFGGLKFFIPPNEISCWFDLDLYVKDCESGESMHIHKSKGNFISGKKSSNNVMALRNVYGNEIKYFKFERIK